MELRRLADLPEAAIDTSDIPERADWSSGERGMFYRPVKKQVTLRIDADVLEWFKAQGGKYQTALNAALREHVKKSSVHAVKCAKTGELCPESGLWLPVGKSSGAISIAKGNRMPPIKRESVVWRLLRVAA